MRLTFGRSMLGTAAAVTLLFGCGGFNGSPFVASEGGAAALESTAGDLLYVANRQASYGVSVLKFPQGTLVATIKQIGAVRGVCSDASGNVWMTAFVKGTRRPFYLYKFRHGGTKPVEVRNTHRYGYGCAVDPTTGDLAVISYGGSSDGVVDVWRGARQGRPAVYYIGIPPAGCAYDDHGDLFVDGIGGTGAALTELVKGGKNFSFITLGKNASWTVANVQWDGTYVALSASTISGSASIYRVRISGERGRIVGMVHLAHLASYPHFVIANGEIVATQSGSVIRRAGVYNYPAGGKALDVFSGFHDPAGMTISVEPK